MHRGNDRTWERRFGSMIYLLITKDAYARLVAIVLKNLVVVITYICILQPNLTIRGEFFRSQCRSESRTEDDSSNI